MKEKGGKGEKRKKGRDGKGKKGKSGAKEGELFSNLHFWLHH